VLSGLTPLLNVRALSYRAGSSVRSWYHCCHLVRLQAFVRPPALHRESFSVRISSRCFSDTVPYRD
jgi:hypothetical protein